MVAQHTVTLANSIVGVSVLAMPFCFKQCGVLLATLILIMGAVMTRMVCYFLLKGAIMTRRRTYELLAFHAFGPGGKFLVEITIIGFLVGTLIAFLVVMGDLGPELIVDVFSIDNNQQLRTVVMTGLALFVVLPLGLLRNIDSLSSVSTASVFFYLFLVFKLFFEALPVIWSGSFIQTINYWRPSGVLQCIPIFSMALSCQTQVLGIYDVLPDPSMQKMNEVVKSAVYICTGFYVTVGLLGYIAFHSLDFGGNVLLLFQPDASSQLIKMCFLLSIAFSFPLVILPCRASLHSLVYRGTPTHHSIDMTTTHIPDSRIKILTVFIVGVTLVMGLIIPNIELVLGLVGSTCGSIICIICPSVIFIRVTTKSTTERLLAQTVLFLGLIIMVLTTYVTLYAVEKAQQEQIDVKPRNVEFGFEDVSRNIPVIPQSLSSNPPSVQFSTAVKNDKVKVKVKEKDKVEKSGGSGQKDTVARVAEKLVEAPLPPVEPVLNNPVEEKLTDVKMKVVVVPPEKSSPSPPPPPKVSEESKKDFVPEEFIKKLEEQNLEQKKLIEQQKEILAQFERHHQEDEERKRVDEEKEKEEKEKEKKVDVGENSKVSPNQLDDKLKPVNEEVEKVVKNEENVKEPKIDIEAVDSVKDIEHEKVAKTAKVDTDAVKAVEQKPIEKDVNVGSLDKVVDNLKQAREPAVVLEPAKAEKVVKVEEKVNIPEIQKAENVVPAVPNVKNDVPSIPAIPKAENVVPVILKDSNIVPNIPDKIVPEMSKADRIVPDMPKFDNVAPQIPKVDNAVGNEKPKEVYQNIVEKPAMPPAPQFPAVNEPVEKRVEAPIVPHAPVLPVEDSQSQQNIQKVDDVKVEKKPDREM